MKQSKVGCLLDEFNESILGHISLSYINIKYLMRQQPRYNHQSQETAAHLNPVIHKLKPSLLKKSNQNTSCNPSTNLLLESQRKRQRFSPTATVEQLYWGHLHSPAHSYQLQRRQSPVDRIGQADEFSHIAESERSFLMERNRELQSQLENKDGKLTELDRKCEQLQMRLSAVHNYSGDSSTSNWGQGSRFQKSTLTSSVLDRPSKIQQLKSIRQRLKKIDFSKFFTASNRPQPTN